jgi:beta-lactamase class A
MKRILLSVLLIILFPLGVFTGIQYEKSRLGSLKGRPVRLDRDPNSLYLIDPLLMCEFPLNKFDKQVNALRLGVEKIIRQEVAKGNASTVAVYFRSLNSEHWFGIKENERFSAASLMKVPVMIAYLKLAEHDPRILKKMLKFDGLEDKNAMQAFKPALSLEKGKSYSVEELIRRMIGYSDNNATGVLYYSIDPAHIDNVLNDLHIDNMIVRDQNSISLKEYTKLFLILYNATYLDPEMSQKAMEFLAMKDFSLGIYAALPSGVAISSKFGEFSGDRTDKTKQLHEVGIVLHERHPFLVGIMTRGDDFETLATVIRSISELVYEEVDKDKITEE